MKDLYEVLGVSKDADQAQIKRAFRKLTQQFHPDRNPNDKSAEERFKEVSTAYEVLGDADKRKLYDEFGEMSLTQGFDPERARAYKQARTGGFSGGFRGGPAGFHFENFGDARETSFDDLLSQLFGGGRVREDLFGGRGRGQHAYTSQKGHDIEGSIEVDFLDALRGVTVPLRIDSADGHSRTLDVKVPQGISDGGKLRLRGQGGAGNPPGDIILTVHVRPHQFLRRKDQDLHLDLPVTAFEAYRGGPVDVPTPWGAITVKLPEGAQNGQKMRIRGKGIQAVGKPPGDLFIHLNLRMPRAGDKDLLNALESLQGHENVRSGLAL